MPKSTEVVLTDSQSHVMGHYYNLFWSVFQKRIKKWSNIPYTDMGNETVDDLYTVGLNAFSKSILLFKQGVRTSEDLYQYIKFNVGFPEIEGKELERKYINYMYNTLKFYIMNYYTRDNKKKSRIRYISIDDATVENVASDFNFDDVDNHSSIVLKIGKFSDDEQIQKRIGLDRKQIVFFLREFFSKENCDFFSKSSHVSSQTIKPMIEELFAKNKINPDGNDRKSFRSFRMKFNELVETFLLFNF